VPPRNVRFLGVKRTWIKHLVMSAFDPKRTFVQRVTTEQHRPEICGISPKATDGCHFLMALSLLRGLP
jgi:hypothetical protein